MTRLLILAATVVAECGYTVLSAVLPALTFSQALALATGLHLLTHWAIARHLTLASALEAAATVLFVDVVTDGLYLHGGLPRATMHLGVIAAIGLYRRWRHRR